MTIKQLSPFSIAELKLEEEYAGKEWAYVPRMPEAGQPLYGLGIVSKGTHGYSPISVFYASAETYEEVAVEADRLNTARGVSRQQQQIIIESSVKGIK